MIWGNPYFRKPPYHIISGFWLLLVPVEKSLCTSCSRCWTHCSCSWRGSFGAPCGGFQKNGGTPKSCKIGGHQCENPMVCGTHIFRNPPKVEGSNHQTWLRWGLDLAFKMWRSKANVQLMFTISHSKSHSFLECPGSTSSGYQGVSENIPTNPIWFTLISPKWQHWPPISADPKKKLGPYGWWFSFCIGLNHSGKLGLNHQTIPCHHHHIIIMSFIIPYGYDGIICHWMGSWYYL